MKRTQRGFTIVELLIVIVVIAILAAITIVAYNGIQERARTSKISSDLRMLNQAVMVARINADKTLFEITGSGGSAGGCTYKSDGANLADLPKSDGCWVGYIHALQAISTASGSNVTNLVDPWGRPYFIDENEGENGACDKDRIGTYTHPYVSGWDSNDTMLIPTYSC